MSEVVSVAIPHAIRDEAHGLGINISAVSRKAVIDAVARMKNKEAQSGVNLGGSPGQAATKLEEVTP